MKNRHRLLLPLVLLLGLGSFAQQNETVQNYIDEYRELAIAEMQRTGVPAAIKLAQGIHETMAGTSNLVLKSNNHFGIKCKSNWSGPSVSHDDDARGECFRKYPSAIDSYKDHSDFLKNSARYASLFNLEPTDYQGWAYGLKKAGYATNPRYPGIIIKLIEDYNLQDYTLIAMGKKSEKEIIFARTEETATEVQPAVTIVQNEAVAEQSVYPAGEFRINDTRVVFVKKGTAYLSIAQEFNVSLSRLFEFNELQESETAGYDQLLYLQRKRKVGVMDFHIVKPGETMRDIAQAEGIRLETLQEYNWMRGDMQPAVGERLSLRAKASAMPKLAVKDNYSISPTDKRWSTN